jgi:NADH dehydrogenase
MNNKLVTVFGASGFVGRHVVRALARRGYRVRAMVRRPGHANHLPPMGQVGQIQLLRGNVRETNDVAAAIERANLVVNLAGILYQRGEQSFEAIHVSAAQSIADQAREAGCTALVHVSAIGANVASESLYASSKGRGEQSVRAAFPDAAILRPSIIFGPEDQFFNRFAGLARALPVLPLVGGGLTRFQPVYVGDVAAAVVRALEEGSAGGKVFELGGPGTYTFRELMEFMLRETARRRILLPIPFPLATLQAFFLQFLRSPLLTPDQVRLLKVDNVVQEGSLTLSDLGIVPTSAEAEVPAYLWRFRPRGQFQAPLAS